MARRIFELDVLRSRFVPELAKALDVVLDQARAGHAIPYLVGGPVRDLLLHRAPVDLDIVVEGDAIPLARAVGDALGLRPRLHEAFRTGSLKARGFTLDLVTARRERYPHPAALPVVEPASIREDLLRRDFTIHAMAIPLDGPIKGTLLDPSGGRVDLAQRLLRVLHERSFIDDPTRLFRVVRYATRLQFEIEPYTLELMERDRAGIALLSPARLRNELARMLGEEEPERSLGLADKLGLLDAIGPALTLSPDYRHAFAELRTTVPVAERRTVAWGILGAGFHPATAASLAARLSLPKRERAAMIGAAGLAARKDLAQASPAAIVAAAERVDLAAVWGAALAAPDPALTKGLSCYLDDYRYVKAALSPAELASLGVPAGPLIGRIAELLRAARLDKLVSSRDDELALVKREIAAVTNGDTLN